MKIEALKRTFSYNAIALADPGAALGPAQVKDFYTAVYHDLTNAEIEGPKVEGNTHAYTFRRAVGTKGASQLTTLHVREYVIVENDEDLHHPDNPYDFDCAAKLLVDLRQGDPDAAFVMYAEVDA